MIINEFFAKIEKNPDKFEEIEQEIWKKFGTHKVVMICDSSGFSHKTEEYGIVHFIMIFNKIVSLVLPIIKKNKGKVVKIYVDNMLITFDKQVDAINCAIEMQKKIGSYNSCVEKKEKFDFCMGVSSGKVLNYNNDVFGQPSIIASKLGEDLAKEGEILIEEQVYENLKTFLGYKFSKKIRKKISNIEINYFKVKY